VVRLSVLMQWESHVWSDVYNRVMESEWKWSKTETVVKSLYNLVCGIGMVRT